MTDEQIDRMDREAVEFICVNNGRCALSERVGLSVTTLADELRKSRQAAGGADSAIRQLEVGLEATEGQLAAVREEVASVLRQLDELAETWGDEGVFRRCRDRLRAIANEQLAAATN